MTVDRIGATRSQRRKLRRTGAKDSKISNFKVLPIVGSLVVLMALPPSAQAADLSADTSTATGGTSARTLADRAADVLNPLDFVASGTNPEDVRTGVADAAPAFNAAIMSRPAGAWVKLVVPAGTYKLDSNVTDTDPNGIVRKVFVDLTSGARVGKNRDGLGEGGPLRHPRVASDRIEHSDGDTRDGDGGGRLQDGLA